MFDILNPTLDMIDIVDIAHAGSQLCRFTGHTKFFYSIAQHELLGSYIVPPENALEFLLHDAAESYVNDMSRPLKHMTKAGDAYRPIEDKIQALIRKKYGLPEVQSPVIHKVDKMMLMAEKGRLMAGAKWEKVDLLKCKVDSTEMADVDIWECWPRLIEKDYLARFNQLIGERDGNY